jgi:FlgD Ig-like domain
MNRFRLFHVSLTIMVLFASGTPRPALAEWPALGRAISTAPGNQNRAHVATDGAGGALITWQDGRGALPTVFVQHVRASGDVDTSWPVDGRALLADPASLVTALGGQLLPVIVADGRGGAIVAWQDERGDIHGPDVFAQHVLASGAVDPAWPANGVPLCAVVGVQDEIAIASDGVGGAIVTWMDGRAGGGTDGSGVDIFAQHVLSSGVVDPRWPANGRALCTAPSTQAFPKIASDGAAGGSGAIVTWEDFRPSATGIDIYAQHVSNAGVVDPAWPVNGRDLSTAPRSELNPTIVPDGPASAGGVSGAIVTWFDDRDTTNHIFAQHVLGSGAIDPAWPASGLAVSRAPVDEIDPVLTSDGAGGAIVTWEDARNNQNHNPYVQHVVASGKVDPNWPVNGRALSLSSGEQFNASIAGDGAGGALVAWEEDSFVFAQHVLPSGLLDPKFPVNGRFLRLLLSFQHDPDIVSSGTGNAIVAWADQFTDPSFDIYAALVDAGGTLSVDPGIGPAGLAFAAPSPNPARGSVTLRFTLPRDAGVKLAIYDVGGRRVRAFAPGALSAGEHSLAWDLRDESGRAVSPGLYLARLDADGQALTQRIAAVK